MVLPNHSGSVTSTAEGQQDFALEPQPQAQPIGNSGALASSSAAAGLGLSGFQDALPSCRIVDLPNDPLVKEYGQNNLRLSRTYEGSGTRVRNVLRKALRGERIKIAVVGGSVSAVSI